jgi:hypothetical protein
MDKQQARLKKGTIRFIRAFLGTRFVKLIDDRLPSSRLPGLKTRKSPVICHVQRDPAGATYAILSSCIYEGFLRAGPAKAVTRVSTQ